MIRLPDSALELPGVVENSIQEKRLVLILLRPGIGGSKEALENEPGIDLPGQGTRGTAPGDMGTVNPGVANIRVHSDADRVNGQFEGP